MNHDDIKFSVITISHKEILLLIKLTSRKLRFILRKSGSLGTLSPL